MKKALKWAAVCAAATVLVCCFLAMPVSAGVSTIVLDTSSLEEGVDATVWNDPEGDLITEGGVLTFPKESTEYTRLISKSMVKISKSHDVLLEGNYRLTLNAMPDKGEFIMAFGMGSIESYVGDMDNLEVALINDGGIKLAVRAFEETGVPIEIVAPTAISARVGSTVTVKVTVMVDGTVTVTAAGKKVSGKAPFTPEGSVGFLQTGSCGVTVLDMNITSYRCEEPENSNFTETFDNDQFNANLLFSKGSGSSYSASYVGVEPYEGNDVLMFHNAGPSVIGTVQMYSNFEITFDVPYLQRTEVVTDAGTSLKATSLWIGVSYGADVIDGNVFGYEDAADMVYFDRDSQVRSLGMNGVVAGSEAYPFFAEEETRPFSCMLRMEDAHVTVGIKWMDEKEFTIIGEYDRNDLITPTGYVQIWTCGPSNFAIDNIKMTNLDADPQTVEVEFKSNKFRVPDDFDYDPDPEWVYRPTEAGTETFTLEWYYILPIASLVVAAIAVVVTAMVVKGKKRKESAPNETTEA